MFPTSYSDVIRFLDPRGIIPTRDTPAFLYHDVETATDGAMILVIGSALGYHLRVYMLCQWFFTSCSFLQVPALTLSLGWSLWLRPVHGLEAVVLRRTHPIGNLPLHSSRPLCSLIQKKLGSPDLQGALHRRWSVEKKIEDLIKWIKDNQVEWIYLRKVDFGPRHF